MATNRVFRHVSGTAAQCNAAAEVSFERRAGNGSRALCDTGCRWRRRIGPSRGIGGLLRRATARASEARDAGCTKTVTGRGWLVSCSI
jgi:hypothetical protein